MYEQTYSDLYTKYPFNNFDLIIETIDKHFCHLFKLNVLNGAVKTDADGSYMKFFHECMSQLDDLYTKEEIIVKLHDYLLSEKAKNDQLTGKFIFVPPTAKEKSKQLGILEKIATGTFKYKPAEPLSFIDMVRIVNGLTTMKKKQNPPGGVYDIAVLTLNHLIIPDAINIEPLTKKKAWVINFNCDLEAPPKWGVIEFDNSSPAEIYCETPLTEREKEQLQNVLGMNLDSSLFVGATANNLASTGYTAISWLDKNVINAWNFDVTTDFIALFKDILVSYFGGDNPGLQYHYVGQEGKKYATPAFKQCMRFDGTYAGTVEQYRPDETSTHPAFAINRLFWAACMRPEQGEICKTIDALGFNRDINNNNDLLKKYLYPFARTLPPAFGATLSTHEYRNEQGKLQKLVTENSDSVTLSIPSKLDIEALTRTHLKVAKDTATTSTWLRLVGSEVPRLGTPEEFYASLIVLAFTRAKAKKRELNINMPEVFQLNEQEQQFIISSLQENPYVTQLNINQNLAKPNKSLNAVKKALTPSLARNRWLADNNYLPPLIDNYWRQAARYWLIHLPETEDLLQPKKEHELFKNCVLEMGLQGLTEVLNLLKDEDERLFFEALYNKQKPAFYAACQSHEYPLYLKTLLKHLESGSYFPYSELGLAYQTGYNKDLIEVLKKLNEINQFKQITLTEFLKESNSKTCKEFLEQLIANVEKDKWVSLLVIPELEDAQATTEETRELRRMYTYLNDLVLQNRHRKASEEVLRNIKNNSNFSMPDKAADSTVETKVHQKKTQAEMNETFISALKKGLNSINKNSKWPLKKGSVTQLQMQQQQQIEQQRQLQQTHRKIMINTIEEALSVTLVDYHNINKLLNNFVDNLEADGFFINEDAATLQDDNDDTLLKGFFHTWINANPHVDARHVIKQMTPDAAKILFRKHKQLTSGLNPDNLPRGFFTQRSKDGFLILCYNPEIAYVNPPNAFTLDLDIKKPKAEKWEGDFRIFNLERYKQNFSKNLDKEDWNDIILFTNLQPKVKKSIYKQEYTDFIKNYGAQHGPINLNDYTDKIIKNWPIFIQSWQYGGKESIKQFLNESSKHTFKNNDIKVLLLNRIENENLREWANNIEMDDRYIRALGQIYYRYGTEGLTIFLSKLRQIKSTLGDEFFDDFNGYVLQKSNNFNCFMNEEFFYAMDHMMEQLSPNDAENKKSAWNAIIKRHYNSVNWENIETLWNAFTHFNAEIANLGLVLEGNEFDEIADGNMLVVLDRICTSLSYIPDFELQKQFLSNLQDLHLNHGDVHYAIQHEKFKHFNNELKLNNFTQGTPTYAPELKELYQWTQGEAKLKMMRTLASQAKFTQNVYALLIQEDKLGNAKMDSRHKLLWLLHSQFDSSQISTVFDQFENIDDKYQERIAQKLHQIFYEKGNAQLNVSFDALIWLDRESENEKFWDLLERYPYGTFLEAATILQSSKRLTKHTIQDLYNLFDYEYDKSVKCPDTIFRDVLKLATLFGISDPNRLQDFYKETWNVPPVVYNEMKRLMSQIFSIDYTGDLTVLTQNDEVWNEFNATIQRMKEDPANTNDYRIEFIEYLESKGIHLKFSKSGEFRALRDTDEDRPDDLGFFIDHENRLLKFMQNHILVPVEGDAKEAVRPIIRFLKRMQLNRTYLNEIEPLLASLEKVPEQRYWSATFFYQLLRALQPEAEQAQFPISLLKTILDDETIAPKKIDHAPRDFPVQLVEPFQTILKNTVFNRDEQTLLAKLALHEYSWQGSVSTLNQLIALLSNDGYEESRNYVLKILEKSKNSMELKQRFESCAWLLQQTPATDIAKQWNEVTALWLKASSMRGKEEELFKKIKGQYDSEPVRQSLILHVVAFSTLRQGLKDSDSYQYELDKKANKLADRLGEMPLDDLIALAKTYPNQPSPTADDILRLLKRQNQEGLSWEECYKIFEHTPFKEPRLDYGQVTSARDADLRRMISETKVSSEKAQEPVSPENITRISIIFSYLKQLENGTVFVKNCNKPIAKMDQHELAEMFNRLSQEPAQDDVTRAQIWAILFEVLGRTTRKYPHLAQQFALIANDVGVEAPTRVLQLATGEGKSHFVAMRAARHAGSGKIVDVCTAKRTLAVRDLSDYQSFFDYLDITTAYIHPKSAGADYKGAQVHYTTLGDLSLFLDDQSYTGQPITIPRNKRVGLFDEFDFIRFEEGRKTEYNYARPTGQTPKQMSWFYQAVNGFYKTNQQHLKKDGFITEATLHEFVNYLKDKAGDKEERQNFVLSVLSDPLQLVQWLQSAYDAHDLVWGVNFTVREENIEVGEESYPMREIIPLSSDNQKMIGSTFSGGVHQLLAELLNTEARDKNEPQNFHVHPESHIISSQVAARRMMELWSNWEGFTGTVSAAQAKALNTEYHTQVLHVPTNQRDLRFWHKPQFFKNEAERQKAITEQTKRCINKKQSVLFSCKNDKQVDEFNKALEESFTDDELLNEHFIFYTNEEHRGADEVLQEKTRKEHWLGGKKQDAVNLVASGFGRGDNVDVEAVFLFDVNDTNDKLQKGGRTARNGAQGEVFQFYISSDLEAEQKRLWNEIVAIQPTNVAELREELFTLPKANADEMCFERVMLLREYVFSIQNAANIGYHNAIAQYSTWGMMTLGQIEDPTLRHQATTTFSIQLKRLDKAWINISGQQNETVDQIINKIEEEVIKISQEFLEYSKREGITTEEFDLERNPKVNIQLVIPPVPKKANRSQLAIASICNVMSRLSDLTIDNPDVAKIPRLMRVVAQNEHELLKLEGNLISCTTLADFIQELKLAAQHVQEPSEAYVTAVKHASKKLAYKDLFINVSDDLRRRSMQLIDRLTTDLQTQLVETLTASNVVSAETRIKDAMPLLGYLRKFTKEQQNDWGAEYIANMDLLTKLIPDHVLSLYLEVGVPMPYSHFVIFSNILNKTAMKSENMANEDYKDLFISLVNATKAEPEQRLRMLNKWETLLPYIEENQAKDFLKSFCKVMEHFKEGIHWDTFITLVDETQAWINKGGRAQYAPLLNDVWHNISNKTDDLNYMNGFLQWALKIGGKGKFEIINQSLKLADKQMYVDYLQQFDDYWKHLNEQKLTKTQKLEKFSEFYDHINCFNEFLGKFNQEDQEHMKQQFIDLRGKDLEHVLQFMSDLGQDLLGSPEALAYILAYYNDASITDKRRELLTKIVLQITRYQIKNKYPLDYDLGYLLNVVNNRFKDCKSGTLELLLQLMEQTEEHDHTVEPLFDNAVFYLEENVPPDSRQEVHEVIQLFYSEAKAAMGLTNFMQQRPKVQEFFNFNSRESHTTRERRLIWMRLLQQQVFVQDMESIDINQNEYYWDQNQNDKMTECGFQAYVDYTGKILGQSDKKVDVGKNRDLSIRQQQHLLSLTDEMKIIGAPKFLRVPAGKDNEMHERLNKLMAGYSASWFKNKQRISQVEQLKGIISRTTGYMNVLEEIANARTSVIAMDIFSNQTRRFKINSSGQSRLYNTLNQMEDMVLRHWTQNSNEFEAIKEYKAFNQQQFIDMTHTLYEQVNAYCKKTYPEATEPEFNKISHRLNNFFSSAKTKKGLLVLKNALESFNEDVNSGKELDTAMVEQLMQPLKTHTSKLPGHLIALANQAIMRGDSLHLNLLEQTSIQAIGNKLPPAL
jgi:hypothetical protein